LATPATASAETVSFAPYSTLASAPFTSFVVTAMTPPIAALPQTTEFEPRSTSMRSIPPVNRLPKS
jgi:hypothetical protein